MVKNIAFKRMIFFSVFILLLSVFSVVCSEKRINCMKNAEISYKCSNETGEEKQKKCEI